jgi:hypothetical protein
MRESPVKNGEITMATAVETPTNETQQPAVPEPPKSSQEMQAGAVGAALGLGVGLFLGEILIPAAILVLAGGLGYGMLRKNPKA